MKTAYEPARSSQGLSLRRDRSPVQTQISILYLDQTYGEISGAQYSLLHLVTHLAEKGYRPVVACRQGGMLWDRLITEGVEVVDVTFPNIQQNSSQGWRWVTAPLYLLRNIIQTATCTARLMSAIRRRKVAIIHVNSLFPRLPGWIAARLTHRRLVWHVRDFVIQRFWLSFYRYLSRSVNRIISVSQACWVQFPPGARVVTVYNGVDCTRFHPDPDRGRQFRREIGVKDDEVLIGWVGLVVRWKGLDVLLEAARKVLERSDRARFVIVGDDFGHKRAGYREELVRQARALGIADRVIFTGFCPDVTVPLSGIDIGLVPSIRPDPFPRSVLEMMAVGVPVVASRIGGIPEMVEHHVTGFLVKPGDVEELVEKVHFLLCDGDLRSQMSHAARRRAEEALSIERNVRETVAVYRSLLG